MQFPALHGNWFDLIIVLFIIFYIWDGWGRGFISRFFELLSFLLAFLFSLKLYPYAAHLIVVNFSLARGISNAAAFFLLGLVFEQLISLVLSKVQDKIPLRFQKHIINQVLAIFPLLLNAMVIVAFILTIVIGLPIKSSFKNGITESKLGSIFLSRTQSVEKTLSGIFGEAFSETFNFLTIQPESEETVKLNFRETALIIDETSEAEMLNLINNERHTHNLPSLSMNDDLRLLAREYARDMFERGYFSHYNPEGESPFDRMDKKEIVYTAAGENLAFAPSLSIAHQGLMDSPGHRANILSPDFGKVGIGVIDGGVYGKMFVQEFTN